MNKAIFKSFLNSDGLTSARVDLLSFASFAFYSVGELLSSLHCHQTEPNATRRRIRSADRKPIPPLVVPAFSPDASETWTAS